MATYLVLCGGTTWTDQKCPAECGSTTQFSGGAEDAQTVVVCPGGYGLHGTWTFQLLQQDRVRRNPEREGRQAPADPGYGHR